MYSTTSLINSFRIKKRLQRFFSWLSILSLVLQTSGGILLYSPALAQEETPTPLPTEILMPSPTVEVTATPTETVSPTVEPTVTVIPTDIPTTEPTSTPTPTNLPTATPTEIPITPTLTPTPSTQQPTPTQAPVPEVLAESTTTEETVQVTVIPSLLTNKLDYAPTDVAEITGQGFLSLTTYTLLITADNLSQTFPVLTEINGSFTYNYQLDGVYRPLYRVEVKDALGIVIAQITFTDTYSGGGNIDLYSQCSNDDGDGYATGDTGCRWTNGNLNSSNSIYHEDDATVQRLGIDDLTNGNHTVILKYSTTKGGKHTYDFMTDDNYSELAPNPLSSADLCDPAITHLANCASLTPVSSGVIPADTNAAGHDVARSARHFKIRNGTWVGSGILNGPTLVEGTYAGDSETIITLQFNVNTATCENKYTKQGTDVCEVLITWGAHVSTQADWGTGNSAVNVSGSPYHVQIASVDGTAITGGGRDNQMAASAIMQTGSIIIHKDTFPNAAQDFSYTTTGGLTPSTFSLDDDAEGTLPNTQIYSALTAGTYSVSEGANTDYAVTISCTDPSGGTTTNNGTRTASIDLAAGETVECTFTNTLQTGTIELKKVWSGTGGQTTLNIGTSAGGTQVDTQLTGSNGTTPLTTGPNTVNQGTYYLSETGGLTNYNTAALSCFNDANNNGTNDSESSVTVGSNESVSVLAGQHVICSYTNTRQQGKIELQKDFVGTPESVTLRIGTSQNGTQVDSDVLSADGTDGEHSVDTGNYFVSEVLTTPANYTSGFTCYNDNNHNNIVDSGDTSHTVNTGTGETAVGNNDDVICVYTNTRKQGTIELQKIWSGTGGQTTLNIGTSNGGSQVDSQLTGASGVAPLTTGPNTVDTGTYYNSEAGGLTDYTTSALSCFNDADNNGVNNSESSVTVGAHDSVLVGDGQHIICTYTNTRQTGKIQLVKDFVGTSESVTINIGSSQGGSEIETKTISIDGATDEHAVDTGSYFVSETLTTPANYDSTLECFNDVNDNDAIDEGDTAHSVTTTTGSVSVGNNDDVICRYTNTRHTGTVELKKIWVGTGGQTTLNIGITAGASDVDSQQTGADGVTPLTTGQNTVDTSTYYLSETGGLTNYDTAALVCFNDANNNGTNDGEASVTVGASDSIAVTTGQHVICTYTNTRQQGTIIVKKVMVGGTDAFNYTGNPSGSISASEGTIQEIVDTGQYTSTEGTKTGWDLTSVVCDDNNSTGSTSTRTATFNVEKDETVTCTFTNTKQGSITIVKDARPNDCQDFAFTFTGQSSFSLDDDSGVVGCVDTDRNQSQTFNNLPANVDYTAAETLPNSFWQLGGVSCVYTRTSDPYTNISSVTTGTTVTLDPGADVTCTFVNNKLGPTRTLGFWQTHTAYTSGIFTTYFAGGMLIGIAPHQGLITNVQTTRQSQLFGAFYAPISKTTLGVKRSPIDQARIQLLQQLVAAKLNCAAFGCSSSVQTTISQADIEYATGSKTTILLYASLLDAYNNSGDTIILTGTPGNATPQASKLIANLAFWNTP